jgi:hypothetical protein
MAAQKLKQLLYFCVNANLVSDRFSIARNPATAGGETEPFTLEKARDLERTASSATGVTDTSEIGSVMWDFVVDKVALG